MAVSNADQNLTLDAPTRAGVTECDTQIDDASGENASSSKLYLVLQLRARRRTFINAAGPAITFRDARRDRRGDISAATARLGVANSWA